MKLKHVEIKKKFAIKNSYFEKKGKNRKLKRQRNTLSNVSLFSKLFLLY